MRAVVDCNVLISGLIRPGGPPALILQALRRAEFEPVLSPAILAEYRRAANYPKVRKALRLSAQELEALWDDILILALWVEPTVPLQPIIAADPSDDAYLLAAVEAGADCLISGDKHLLELKSYEGVRILSPRQFLEALP